MDKVHVLSFIAAYLYSNGRVESATSNRIGYKLPDAVKDAIQIYQAVEEDEADE